VTFELEFDEESQGVKVHTLFNGKALAFPDCPVESCTFDKFEEHLGSIWFGDDINEGCEL